MAVATNYLERTLSCILQDKDGSYRQGAFPDLSGDLHFRIAFDEAKHGTQQDGRRKPVMRYLRFIAQDLWNMETLLDRLNWQRELWIKNELTDGRWRIFTTADIDLFHVEFRSLFDYVARLVRVIADKPGSVPDDASFEKLSNWVAKSDSNVARIGEDIAEMIGKADWFKGLREVRNEVVHQGADTLVFYDKPRILFQVHDSRMTRLIDIPEVAYNSNVVDFELYAAVFYSYLIAFLEDMAEVVYRRLGLDRRIGATRQYNRGIEVAKTWMEKVVHQLSLQPASSKAT